MIGPGSKEKFTTDDKDYYNHDKPNEPQRVTDAFVDFMNSKANVLLLSGAAGSGKSTAYDKLQSWILDDYTKKKKKEVMSSPANPNA